MLTYNVLEYAYRLMQEDVNAPTQGRVCLIECTHSSSVISIDISYFFKFIKLPTSFNSLTMEFSWHTKQLLQ